ncbi:MAG: response regulator [Arcobacteraceae bacterium]|nr:response regulator [Arcobacteraceae bacterium]
MNYMYDLAILYVEDEKDIRESMNNLFQEIFSTVIVAVDGKDGLEKYIQNHNKSKSIDLVITDITMPNMNGFEMVEELQKINQDLHVIMISALQFGSLLKDFNRIGAINQFIAKPIEYKTLVETLEKAIKNINARKEYKKQYSLSSQYHNALDYIAIITKTDRNGIITFVSDAFCQISGYKRDELIGRSHNIVRDPSLPKEFFKKLWGTIQSKTIFKYPSLPNRAKNGEIYYVDTTILPILDDKGNIEEYLSIRFDVTALEHQIRADKKALQSQEKFLANMSHEIRTPLNGILGFAKILQKQITDPELKEYAEVINHSGKNLLSLINQILDLAKVQNGHMELDKSWVSFSDIVAIIKLFDINTKEKKIDLRCALCKVTSDDLFQRIEIYTDSLKLKQVISNLINNAIKFTPTGGYIIFDVKINSFNEKTIKLRFSVKDNGIGIPKDKQEQIFEPFKQADLSTTREYGGTGLGLTLAKDFVKLFDSELKVESELEQGSEFYFEVEFEYKLIEKRINYVEESIKSDIAEIALTGTILVAEDVEINQKLIEIILMKLGLVVVFVNNGVEAVEYFIKQYIDIDAVLLDINMPIMDGMEACKKINAFKNENNIVNIPIIALTANAISGDKERYLQMGFDEYLAKPIDNDKLFEVLKRYLQIKNKNLIVENNKTTEIIATKIDFEQNAQRLSLPFQFYQELLQDYCKLLEKEIPQLSQAIESKDVNSIKEIAHKLKGVSGNLAIDILFSKFKAIEENLKRKEYLEIKHILDSINTIINGDFLKIKMTKV